MYTLADALRLRTHVLEKWEAADKDPALIEDGALNVVVVGGGPTGIESVGALAELYRHSFSKDYPAIPQEQARLTLVEAGPELFSMFKPDIREYTHDVLEEFGIEVRTGEAVSKIGPTRVTLKSGEELKAHTLVWGAGLQANAISQSLGVELERGNRVPVGPDLSIADHPEAFAPGDVAWISEEGSDTILPQLGSVALQSGECAGENIARLVAGKSSEAVRIQGQGHDGDDRPRRRRRAVQARQDDEGQVRRPRWAPSIWRCSPPARTVQRRWWTGPGPGSRTSGRAGSAWTPTSGDIRRRPSKRKDHDGPETLPTFS